MLFIDIKPMNIDQKMVIKSRKKMKPYSKAMILSIKDYENIQKFNFLILSLWTY